MWFMTLAASLVPLPRIMMACIRDLPLNPPGRRHSDATIESQSQERLSTGTLIIQRSSHRGVHARARAGAVLLIIEQLSPGLVGSVLRHYQIFVTRGASTGYDSGGNSSIYP
ncbi:hypothetical protein QBC39DRAFT_363543 [Podospora conica]|nr:hypothetical protein QBC39DRAFT_363543 [Schizothecium conicum]